MEHKKRIPRVKRKVKCTEEPVSAIPAIANQCSIPALAAKSWTGRGMDNADAYDSELQTMCIKTGLNVLFERAESGDGGALSSLKEICSALEGFSGAILASRKI